MNYTNTSWFHLSNFTRKGCDFEWMMGVNKWIGIKDYITGNPIKNLETVFWNRKLGNICVSVDTYNNIVKGSDEGLKKRLGDIELPLDIRV